LHELVLRGLHERISNRCRLREKYLLELPLIYAEVVEVQAILSGNLLEIIFQEHRHIVDEVF